MSIVETVTAEAINREHGLARSCAESAVQHAIRCGELLIEQKDRLQHGEFGDWVKANCEFGQHTARIYMRAAEQNERGLSFSSLNELLKSDRAAKQSKLTHIEPVSQPETEFPF